MGGYRTAQPAALGVAVASLTLTACGGDGSAGAEGSAEPAVWTVSPASTVTIGETEGDSEYLLQQVEAARLLPDGRIVVADAGTPPIRLYGPDGAFIRGMGGRGEGPGEFAGVGSLSVIPPDTIDVYDWRTFRLTRFLADGSLVSVHSFMAGDGRPELYLGRFPNGDHGFAWITIGTGRLPAGGGAPPPSVDSMRLGRFGPDGRFLEALHTTTGMRRLGSPVPFSPFLHAALLGDTIAFTDGLRPELTLLGGDGRVVGALTVPIEAADPAAAWEALEARIRAGDVGDSPIRWSMEQAEAVQDREMMPHIADMVLDDRERLWLKRFDPATDNFWTGTPGGTGGEWFVVETDGRVVATTRLPDGLALLDVRGDRIVGVTRDELGVERIAVHDISR